jgi:hypothetical protein
MAAGQVQARGGGGDDVEWGVNCCALGERNAYGPGEEVVAVF